MVLLKDLFNLLATGEFANISLSRSASGGINESDYSKVINHLNMGILEIYKRFAILENEVVLHVYPTVSKYYLRPDRLVIPENINSNNYIEYPADTEGCLNIVGIQGVFDSDGNEIKINDRHYIPTVRQTAHDILTITNVETEQTLSIVYRAFPTKIELTEDFDIDTYAVSIPEYIIDALLYSVAARVYKPMGSNDSTANADKSSRYEQQYELACQKIAMYGLVPTCEDNPDIYGAEGWA